MIRNAWYAAGFSTEFPPGDVQGQTIAGRPVVLWRTAEGEVTALDGRCAHKRFPLWEGRLLDDGALECAYHGFAYDETGRCVRIPALHDRADRIPTTARQYRFPVVEQDGLVWIWPGDPERAAGSGPPPTPEVGSADWETVCTEPMPVAASARLLIENLFDLTHFYPLHAGNIGTLADALVPVEIERETRDGQQVVRTIRRRHDFAFAPMTVDRFGVEVGDQVQIHEMVGPGLFRVVVKVAPPGRLETDEAGLMVLYQTITPVAEDRHVWRRAICCRADARWARDPAAKSLAEAIAEGAPVVVEQDRWAIEQQQKMMAYPDEGYREVHIRTDGAVVMARRVLDELEAAESGAAPGTTGATPARISERPRRRTRA
jgi:phenylpropionate dioxygenase-like ring-hydroxylating dioxygenase large terminal subunit